MSTAPAAGGDLAGRPEVVRWLAGAGYDSRPAADREEVLGSLAGFCAFAGRTPAGLVASCLRDTASGTAISGKGRREMEVLISRYVAERGLQGRSGVVVGNHIRGFLVHNGVFMQGPVAM